MKSIILHTGGVDPFETSNSGRIYIWKQSLESVIASPVFGVAIGNYPVILNQDVSLAKAGSSAHNLFLQIAAEIGLIGFAVTTPVGITFNPNACNSFTSTLNDSGTVDAGISVPFTIASNAFALPTTSSDFIVSISCST